MWGSKRKKNKTKLLTYKGIPMRLSVASSAALYEMEDIPMYSTLLYTLPLSPSYSRKRI